MIFPISKAKYSILKCIFYSKKIKISDLLKRCNVSQKSGYRYVNELISSGIISESREGGKPVLRFLLPDFNTETGILLFSALEAEKKIEFIQKNKTLKGPLEHFIEEIRDIADSAVIFGSYARGGQTKESDIDIAILCPKKDKGRIEKAVERCFVTLENRVSARIFEPENFFLSSDPLIQSILKEHIVLFNFANWIKGYSKIKSQLA